MLGHRPSQTWPPTLGNTNLQRTLFLQRRAHGSVGWEFEGYSVRIPRLVVELSGLSRTLGAADFARYVAAVALQAPAILKSGTLVPADRQMGGVVRFRTWRDDLRLDCDAIDGLVGSFDKSLVFSLARELCGRNVYFRAFRPFSAAPGVILDLGANRGLFSALAIAATGARKVICVEPQAVYLPALRELTDGLGAEVKPVTGFAGSSEVAQSLSDLSSPVVPIPSLLARGERIAFLKADIEGAEEALMAPRPDWLRLVDRIAMETHPDHCDVAAVHDALQALGFAVFPSNAIGDRVAPARAEFLYAALNPEFLGERFVA